MIWMLTTKMKDAPDPAGPMPKPEREEVGDFYVRLGMAISAWQFVETALYTIYSAAVGTASLGGYQALSAAFHVPSGFRVRLDMTNEAVLRSPDIPETVRAEWPKLYARARKRGLRRNEIAHATVMFQPVGPKIGNRLFLAQSVVDSRRVSMEYRQEDIITASGLEAAMKSFEVLRRDLEGFRRKLPAAVRP